MTETLIKIENLHKNFGKNEVLKGIDLEIKKGEVVNAKLAPIIKVYHCNLSEKCNEFISENKLLESNHPYDSLWLGNHFPLNLNLLFAEGGKLSVIIL